MTTIFNGCSFGEIFISPKNWKTTTAKASLEKSWFVQCRFHDPNFPKYNPKGFPYRRKINKDTTSLEERRAVAEFVRDEMESILKQGYNPITNTFTAEPEITKEAPSYTPETPLFEALDLAFSISESTGEPRKDIKRVIDAIKISLTTLGFENIQVGQFLGLHLKLALDNMKVIRPGFTDKRYNRYIANLSPLFKSLKRNGMVMINPCEGVSCKTTTVEARLVLTLKERIRVDTHLRTNYPTFYIFTQVFFHSSGRIQELLALKPEHVDLYKLKYKTFIKKGKLNKWVDRPIKKVSLDYWIEALKDAKPDEFVFSENLQPGKKMIRRDQVTKRWRVHVKEKLGITADFYSLKHSNLTEISERSTTRTAAKAAGHTSDKMIKQHYDVGSAEREMNAVRNMTNTLAPQVKIRSGELCNPTKFVFGFRKLTA